MFMSQNELISDLFRTEFRKIIAVLIKTFGIDQIKTAEDIVSDTFLVATKTWQTTGIPNNPKAWLYKVAKNKTLDVQKRNDIYRNKVVPDVLNSSKTDFSYEIDIDLSKKGILDSQLKTIFAICNKTIPENAQIALALRILCGFGVEEIANAFLVSKDTINKRLFRAKEKLRAADLDLKIPKDSELEERLNTVLKIIYLLFNEGYYSQCKKSSLRKDLCYEAVRLNYLLTNCETTNKPSVNALLSLMCFHTSRFEARMDQDGEFILYEDQDIALWDTSLIEKGRYYLRKACTGDKVSKYHLEAAIGYWHTIRDKDKTQEKWDQILQLYNQLLQIEYSTVAALNRTYALSKVKGKRTAIKEAEKLKLSNNHLYYSLLGDLYEGIDELEAKRNYKLALRLARIKADKSLLSKKIDNLMVSTPEKEENPEKKEVKSF